MENLTSNQNNEHCTCFVIFKQKDHAKRYRTVRRGKILSDSLSLSLRGERKSGEGTHKYTLNLLTLSSD